MGTLLCEFSELGKDRGCHLSPQFGVLKMNAHVKSYLWFLGFMLATKIVVKPIADNLNIPLLKDALA